jgi:2-keto-4-pentenoate hydratase/2-oxohepta-3-ene-1,7-dioic acid hydratase in catechol pathway
MRLLRYGPPGREKPAILDPRGRLRDLSGHISDLAGSALLPEALESIRAIDPASLPEVPDAPRIGPCVGNVGKIIGVGLNYRDHAAESGMPIPSEPPLFLKPSSAIIGPNDDVQIPLGSERTDWEVEAAIVVGKPGKNLRVEQAREHIAALTILNDISERSWQLERGGQWDKGKGCDTFAPIGPWLVTLDEIPDLDNLDLWLEVDGHEYQRGNTSNMIFNIPYLIAYISQFFSLRSGDIISTGTPPGVGLGQKPPKYLRVGQTMRLGITGLGIQQQRTVPATAA